MTWEEARSNLEKLLQIYDDGMIDFSIIRESIKVAIEALKEQKTGKWIILAPCFEEICMCSNCKTRFKEAYQHRDTCPSCGARME